MVKVGLACLLMGAAVWAGQVARPVPGPSAATAAQSKPSQPPVPIFKDYAYTANSGSNTISVFSLNSATGVPTLVQTASAGPIATEAPSGAFIHPSKKYLYVANYGSNTISSFWINPGTGEITLVGQTVTGKTPAQLYIHPSGKFVYAVNNGASTVSMHRVGSNGLLEAPLAFPTANPPAALVGDRAGHFLYVTLNGPAGLNGAPGVELKTNNLVAYRINSDNGNLGAPLQVYSAGKNPLYMAMTIEGRNLYVSNGDNQLMLFSVNPLSGLLNPSGAVNTGLAPLQPVIDPSGKFLYVDNSGSNTLSQFNIDPNIGVLTPGLTIKTGVNPQDNEYSPNGDYLYVLNANDNEIMPYKVDHQTGALTPGKGVVAGTSPFSVALVRIP